MKPKYVVAISGLIMIMGSFLPWVAESGSLGLTRFNLIMSEVVGSGGIVTLLAGVIIVLAAFLAKEGPGTHGSLVAAILGIVVIGIALEYFRRIATWSAVPGVGLLLIIIGSLGAIISGYRLNPIILTTSETTAPPTSTEPIPPESWLDIWNKALLRPIVPTYEALARDANATTDRARAWVAISAVIGALLGVGLGSLAGGNVLPSFGALSCGAFTVPLIAFLSFIIASAISDRLARRLGGTGTYPQLAYAFAAYLAPLTLIASALSSIPSESVQAVSFGFGIYGVALSVVAVKGVHRLSWGRSIAASFFAAGLFLVLITVIGIAFFTWAFSFVRYF